MNEPEGLLLTERAFLALRELLTTGGLRAIITPVSTETYHARYHATYAGILTFGYEMDLRAEERDGATWFYGHADLGALAGGKYHYAGRATDEEFVCLYEADEDHGFFRMKRPEAK